MFLLAHSMRGQFVVTSEEALHTRLIVEPDLSGLEEVFDQLDIVTVLSKRLFIEVLQRDLF